MIWVIVLVLACSTVTAYLEHKHTQKAIEALHKEVPPMAASTWASDDEQVFAFALRDGDDWVIQHWRAKGAKLTQSSRVPKGRRS